jgi:hypothetical protein
LGTVSFGCLERGVLSSGRREALYQAILMRGVFGFRRVLGSREFPAQAFFLVDDIVEIGRDVFEA